MGAHLHDYAVEMRLEDAVNGKVLARIKTKREPDGRLISVSTTKFLLKLGGLRVKANHPYRVVAVYDNPTKETISDGAMAFLVGAFIPDDVSMLGTIRTFETPRARPMAWMSSPSQICQRTASATGSGC